MNSAQDYEVCELRILARDLEEVERAPIQDRKEARVEWASAMRERPAIVAERVGWLLDGSYGHGAYIHAWQAIHGSRLNRSAHLCLLIAALEWKCPNAFARGAWRSLSQVERDSLESAVRSAIESAIAQREEEDK